MIEETGIRFATVDGHELLLDRLRPAAPVASPRPAVIWVHGGGWYRGAREASPNRVLAEAGYETFTIDYRLAGDAPFPAQLHDVKRAIRWVREHAAELDVDPDRIGIWGHSAGGHLALFAALSGDDPAFAPDDRPVSDTVRAVVAGCAPTDVTIDWYAAADIPVPDWYAYVLPHFLGAEPLVRPDLARRASPMWYVGSGAPPCLMFHGDADISVPIHQARAFAARSREFGNDVTLRTLPGIDHDTTSPLFAEDDEPFHVRREVLTFFDRHLRG